MTLFVGLDIGGTKLMAAAGDGGREIVRRIRRETPTALEEGLRSLHAMVEAVAAGEDIGGIGAAVGGPLDWRTGVVSPLHQPSWREVPLKEIMEERWECPFWVDVDTNVAALGEYAALSKPVSRLLYITVSTGMGGGLVVDGRLYRGADGGHPEVGHQAINSRCTYPERVWCECGAKDCVEAFVSGNGIRRLYGKPAHELSAAEWEEVAWNLGRGLRNCAALYVPDLIALGGGVATGGGEPFIATVEAVMKEELKIVPAPKVVLSTLGYDTALYGALIVAQKGLGE
ncbi:MAG: ROK family protein [Chitinivibrionales bacterium]|nr:ROK family protein [Chitinivibrionales bacterium]MBD3356533.1 ROK family protein [Chitinivibrionales bacterium]